MINPEQLLTPEESSLVEGALMTTKEKFSTRVAIYGLRVLKQIGAERGMALDAIGAAELNQFLTEDEQAQQAVAQNGFAIDESFKGFWAQIILSSIKPLHQVAAAQGIGLGDLTVGQIIAGFEAKSKALHNPDVG